MIKDIQGERDVYISDFHAPFQDDRAIKVVYNFVKSFGPTHLIYMGDGVDFYAISKFIRDPKRVIRLQDELDSAKDILKFFNSAAPQSAKHYLEGNHEERMERFVFTHPEVSSLRSLQVENMLGLKEMGIAYHKDGHMQRHGVHVKHGSIVRAHSAWSAKAEHDCNGVSGISCHTHRLGTYYKQNRSGYYKWMEGGCLCRIKNVHYLKGQQPNWHQGIVVGFYKTDSGRFHITELPIAHNKIMFGMKEYS